MPPAFPPATTQSAATSSAFTAFALAYRQLRPGLPASAIAWPPHRCHIPGPVRHLPPATRPGIPPARASRVNGIMAQKCNGLRACSGNPSRPSPTPALRLVISSSPIIFRAAIIHTGSAAIIRIAGLPLLTACLHSTFCSINCAQFARFISSPGRASGLIP